MNPSLLFNQITYVLESVQNYESSWHIPTIIQHLHLHLSLDQDTAPILLTIEEDNTDVD